jgi:hypothetical protein
MYIYSGDYQGSFPQITMVGTSISVPMGQKSNFTTGAVDNDTALTSNMATVTMNLWKLVRAEFAQVEIFICPSSEQAGNKVNIRQDNASADSTFYLDFPWASGTGSPVNDKTISYSTVQPWSNLGSSRGTWDQWSSDMDPRCVIAADQNNGNDPTSGQVTTNNGDNSPAFTTLKASVNSKNHQGDGQNATFGDGHVSWTTSAYTGISNDNIYTSDNTTTLNVRPLSYTAATGYIDTVLIPVDTLTSNTKKWSDWTKTTN